MVLLIQSNYVVGTAADGYAGDDAWIEAPDDFDISWMTEYRLVDGEIIIPPPPPINEAQRTASLWQAAHDYEYAAISGSAIGLLALGVIQQTPKCIAVQAWLKSIWVEYYTRMANGSTNYDFSFAGGIPYSIPELIAEVEPTIEADVSENSTATDAVENPANIAADITEAAEASEASDSVEDSTTPTA